MPFQKPLEKCFKPTHLIGYEKKVYDYLKKNSYGIVASISQFMGVRKETIVKVMERLWQNRIVERISVQEFMIRNNSPYLKKPKAFMAAHHMAFTRPNLNVYMLDLGTILGDEEQRATERNGDTIEQSILKENK